MTTTTASTPHTFRATVGRPGIASLPDTVDAATRFIRGTLEASGQQRVVIGLSGGIDSAVVAFLAARALRPEQILLVRMPYGLLRTPRFAPSTQASLDDAQLVLATMPEVPHITVDIAEKVDATAGDLAAAAFALARRHPGLVNRWPDIAAPENAPIVGNLKARARADVLRAMANQYSGLVLGTENRSEHLAGYFTLGGDEESDLEVLSPFLKTEVRQLAAYLGVPQPIQDKAPSADLWVGHSDESELGMTYADFDRIIAATDQYVATAVYDGMPDPEQARTDARAAAHLARTTDIAPATIARAFARIQATAYKRAPKPTFAGA